MNDESSSPMFGLLVGFVVGATVAGILVSNNWRESSIDRGLALYCPQDGQWAWVGECKE